MLSGPPGLRLVKGFHDEALSGEWKGHRSSRLGIQYRAAAVSGDLHHRTRLSETVMSQFRPANHSRTPGPESDRGWEAPLESAA